MSKKINTLGELKKSGYATTSVKDEMRRNLELKLKNNEPIFSNIIGYEDSVVTQLERAILSGHNINFL